MLNDTECVVFSVLKSSSDWFHAAILFNRKYPYSYSALHHTLSFNEINSLGTAQEGPRLCGLPTVPYDHTIKANASATTGSSRSRLISTGRVARGRAFTRLGSPGCCR